MLLGVMRSRASDFLKDAGFVTPLLEIDILCCYVFGVERAQLPLLMDSEVTDEAHGFFWQLLERRAKREPLAYLVGNADFYGYRFFVGPGCLIPRPETESLVEKVLMKAPHTGRFADLCTGSGCIALSLLMENERYTAIGTDTSPGALRWAWLNTRRYRMHGRLLLWHSFDPGWMPCRARSLDFIVANPPYIPSMRLAELMTDVRDYEPHVALDGGEDGLDLLFGVLRAAVSLLKEGGLLFCETGGEDQLQALGLAVPRPLELAEVFEDGFGVARHAVFKKSTS